MKGNQGMWIFLATEVLIFGVLIYLYQLSYFTHEEVFREETKNLHFYHGTVNTLILLTSSYFVALAESVQRKRWLLWAICLGLLFLTIKGFEYYDLIQEGKFPLSFINLKPKTSLFYTFYAFLTMLHAIHIMIGIGLLFFVWYFNAHHFQENVGLYWHFVDMVWVFIYPLFYLVR